MEEQLHHSFYETTIAITPKPREDQAKKEHR